MGFRLIKGTFAPRLGKPDGDSVRFIPDKPSLFKGLKGKSIKIHNNQGAKSVQLRYEGIDTMEKSAAQPWSRRATKANLKLIGGPGRSNQKDSRGYILTRRGDTHRRPISFVFAGDPSEPDGEDVFLDVNRMKKSVNYQLLRKGHAYPMFYDTLFTDLRDALADATIKARKRKKGIWADDATKSGVRFTGKASLKTMPPVFPKLWRRLKKWGRKNDSLAGFKKWLPQLNDSIEIIHTADDGQFVDVIKVSGDRVRMTERPENLEFRSAAT